MKNIACPLHHFTKLAFTLSLATSVSANWIGSPEVHPAHHGHEDGWVDGVVFHDLNGDSQYQKNEPGLPNVKVTNGREVVLTTETGAYRLPVMDDMNLSVVQPSGWKVPVDERMVPQFSYVHKEKGSPEGLRFGGLPPTGPAPSHVNFPLKPADGSTFKAAIVGDSQTYSNQEVSFLRKSTITDLLALGEDTPDLMLYVGDVVGDDMGLLDRLLHVGAAVEAPQWLVLGNHDIDFDAKDDAHSSDTFRRIFGPNYYAFEEGETIFVVLDNVVYPCGEEDMMRPGRDFCSEEHAPTYNGRVPDAQMAWLENLLAVTDPSKLVVFAHHIPFASFADPRSTKHQTDNLFDIYKLVEGREALSLSGHTHTMENHAAGQSFEGWEESIGIQELAFRHIIAGAASGSWYQGDLNYRGVPMALQRLGAPKGVLLLDFEGAAYEEEYLGAGVPRSTKMWTSLNTPNFRNWFNQLVEWSQQPLKVRAGEAPPFSINDLGDNLFITADDLKEGVWITANVWDASSESKVTVSLNGGEKREMERTQKGAGEAVKIGAEWADPFSAQRQLSVSRYALESTSGIERHQGFEVFRGSRFGPVKPQPMGRLADRNMHLWRLKLPASLEPGVYKAMIEEVDRHGNTAESIMLFEVDDERPPMLWRKDVWAHGHRH